MEKEQIIKALECCANYKKFGDCNNCPAREGCANEASFLKKEALSLVVAQDKRIEELTLKCAGFKAGAKAAARFIRAETVRKMQEKFTMHFGTYTTKDEVKISEVFRLLSKFANEIVEGAE